MRNGIYEIRLALHRIQSRLDVCSGFSDELAALIHLSLSCVIQIEVRFVFVEAYMAIM